MGKAWPRLEICRGAVQGKYLHYSTVWTPAPGAKARLVRNRRYGPHGQLSIAVEASVPGIGMKRFGHLPIDMATDVDPYLDASTVEAKFENGQLVIARAVRPGSESASETRSPARTLRHESWEEQKRLWARRRDIHDTAHDLDQAVLDYVANERVHLEHTDQETGVTNRWIVVDAILGVSRGRIIVPFYLTGNCELRRAYRCFRIDRISSLTLEDGRRLTGATIGAWAEGRIAALHNWPHGLENSR